MNKVQAANRLLREIEQLPKSEGSSNAFGQKLTKAELDELKVFADLAKGGTDLAGWFMSPSVKTILNEKGVL